MKFFTEDQMKSLATKFFADPEWHLVEDIFMNFIEPMVSIDNLDISDTNESVKGEIRAKKEMYASVVSFFTEAKRLATGQIITVKDPRDSLE